MTDIVEKIRRSLETLHAHYKSVGHDPGTSVNQETSQHEEKGSHPPSPDQAVGDQKKGRGSGNQKSGHGKNKPQKRQHLQRKPDMSSSTSSTSDLKLARKLVTRFKETTQRALILDETTLQAQSLDEVHDDNYESHLKKLVSIDTGDTSFWQTLVDTLEKVRGNHPELLDDLTEILATLLEKCNQNKIGLPDKCYEKLCANAALQCLENCDGEKQKRLLAGITSNLEKEMCADSPAAQKFEPYVEWLKEHHVSTTVGTDLYYNLVNALCNVLELFTRHIGEQCGKWLGLQNLPNSALMVARCSILCIQNECDKDVKTKGAALLSVLCQLFYGYKNFSLDQKFSLEVASSLWFALLDISVNRALLTGEFQCVNEGKHSNEELWITFKASAIALLLSPSPQSQAALKALLDFEKTFRVPEGIDLLHQMLHGTFKIDPTFVANDPLNRGASALLVVLGETLMDIKSKPTTPDHVMMIVGAALTHALVQGCANWLCEAVKSGHIPDTKRAALYITVGKKISLCLPSKRSNDQILNLEETLKHCGDLLNLKYPVAWCVGAELLSSFMGGDCELIWKGDINVSEFIKTIAGPGRGIEAEPMFKRILFAMTEMPTSEPSDLSLNMAPFPENISQESMQAEFSEAVPPGGAKVEKYSMVSKCLVEYIRRRGGIPKYQRLLVDIAYRLFEFLDPQTLHSSPDFLSSSIEPLMQRFCALPQNDLQHLVNNSTVEAVLLMCLQSMKRVSSADENLGSSADASVSSGEASVPSLETPATVPETTILSNKTPFMSADWIGNATSAENKPRLDESYDAGLYESAAPELLLRLIQLPMPAETFQLVLEMTDFLITSGYGHPLAVPSFVENLTTVEAPQSSTHRTGSFLKGNDVLHADEVKSLWLKVVGKCLDTRPFSERGKPELTVAKKVMDGLLAAIDDNAETCKNASANDPNPAIKEFTGTVSGLADILEEVSQVQNLFIQDTVIRTSSRSPTRQLSQIGGSSSVGSEEMHSQMDPCDDPTSSLPSPSESPSRSGARLPDYQPQSHVTDSNPVPPRSEGHADTQLLVKQSVLRTTLPSDEVR
jgi:hypothetical protein